MSSDSNRKAKSGFFGKGKLIITLIVLIAIRLAYGYLNPNTSEFAQQKIQESLRLSEQAKDGSACIDEALQLDTTDCGKDANCPQNAIALFAKACLYAVGMRNPELLVEPCDLTEEEFEKYYCERSSRHQSQCQVLGSLVRDQGPRAACGPYLNLAIPDN